MRDKLGILILLFLWSTAGIAQTFEKTTTGIKVTIQSVDVQLQFYTPSTSFVEFDDAGDKTFRVKQTFVLDKDEPIYGLGNQENGRLSQRGENSTLMPGNVEDGIPYFQSVKGYGLFWDNYSPTNFADNESGTSFESEVGDCVDYYFMYGGNADGVVAEIRKENEYPFLISHIEDK